MRSFITVLCMVWGVGEAQAAEWPEEYSVGVSSAVSEGPWWHELGDAQLSGAVDRALAGNPDLRAAHALHVQSKAIAMQQGSALFPQASLNARASLAPTESLGFGFGIPRDPTAPKTYSQGQGTLDLQWQVDLFGRSVATWHAARSDANAAEADAEGRDRFIASMVVGAYLDVVAARQRVQTLEVQLKTNEDLLTAIELRYQGGDAGSLDVLQQRQQVASARAGLPTAHMFKQTTEQRLAVLQGLTPTTPVATGSELPLITDEASIGAPSDLERNRPDLIAASRRLSSARDRRWASVAGALPAVGATAQYGTQFIDRGEMTSQGFWTVGGSLSVPLFNGGRHLGSVRQTRAAYDVADASFESKQLAALQQVESALVREHRQRELVDAQRAQLEASDQAWTVAREQYLRGLTPFINVQTTLSRRQLAELSLIGGERDLLTARIAVHDAIGGTWIATNIKEVVR